MAEIVPGPILAVQSRQDQDGGGIARMPVIDGGDGCLCRTPTSKESKIPAVSRSCPPAAPMKKPRRAVLCKRRLSEIELFRVEANALDRLFRWRDDQQSTAPPSSSDSSQLLKKLKQASDQEG